VSLGLAAVIGSGPSPLDGAGEAFVRGLSADAERGAADHG